MEARHRGRRISLGYFIRLRKIQVFIRDREVVGFTWHHDKVIFFWFILNAAEHLNCAIIVQKMAEEFIKFCSDLCEIHITLVRYLTRYSNKTFQQIQRCFFTNRRVHGNCHVYTESLKTDTKSESTKYGSNTWFMCCPKNWFGPWKW